jgi:hypothetical protein
MTSRTFDPKVPLTEASGHFYISSYGIRVQAAPNTLIAWRPSDWHGTSLFRLNPFRPADEFHQRGLCFVTGNRLFNAIEEFKSRNLMDSDFVHSEPETEEERKLDEYVENLRRSPRLAARKKKNFSRHWLNIANGCLKWIDDLFVSATHTIFSLHE